jgi:exopolysaccharide biosynthesis polyprenyl glycosylphosphotransferase
MMHEARRRLLLNCLYIADLAVMIVAFGLGLVVSGYSVDTGSLHGFLAVRVSLSNFLFAVGFAACWHVIFRATGLYRSRRIGLLSTEWWDITKSVSVATALLAGSATVFDFTAVNRQFLLTFFAVALIATLVMRTCLRSMLGEVRRKGRNLRNLVIIGCGPRGAKIGEEIRKRPDLGYLLLGYIDEISPPKNPLHGQPDSLLGQPREAREILSNLEVDEVVICLPIKSYYETISELIKTCADLGLLVRVPADFFESRLVHAYVDDLHDTPVLTLRTDAPRPLSIALKRAVDLVGATVALTVLSPVLLIIALAIKIDSRGPVLFVQERVGLRRRLFRMVKFRTMAVGADREQAELEDDNEVKGGAFKIKNDPRVTRVGRLLRKLSLDELPQFWNVLIGNMSLVGPRPLPMRDVTRFDSEWQKRRFSVKPGLTCLWQINGRHEIDFDHWMQMDLQYIDNWSLSLDFDILFKTLPAVLRGTGAS